MHKLCIATISPLAAILARSQCNYLVWEVSNLNLHVQEEYPISRCFVQEQLSHLRSLPVQEHILRVWRGEYHGEGASWGLRSEYSQESGIKIEVGVIIFQNWAAEIILQRRWRGEKEASTCMSTVWWPMNRHLYRTMSQKKMITQFAYFLILQNI